MHGRYSVRICGPTYNISAEKARHLPKGFMVEEREVQEKEIVNCFNQQAREGKTAEEAIRNLLQLFGQEDQMPEFKKNDEKDNV